MSLKKTEEILYSLNKKIHYRQLQQMKPVIDSTPPRSINSLPKPYQLIPYNRRYQIKTDNKQMINKILAIAQQDISPKDGYFPKPTRSSGMQKWQLAQDNKNLYDRLIRAKPAIGSIESWNRDYSRSTCARGNSIFSKKISHSNSKMGLENNQIEQSTYRRYYQHENYQRMNRRAVSKKLFKLRLPSFQQVKTQGNVVDDTIDDLEIM